MFDLLDRPLKATRKHGFKTYAIIEEAEGQLPSEFWQRFTKSIFTAADNAMLTVTTRIIARSRLG